MGQTAAPQNVSDLRQFLVETAPTVPIWQFVPGLIATAVLCYSLGLFYRRFGSSLSNRSAFANNFAAIGMTTMLIITIVKSSLALSLGLVGALSIVRFRTAIKEPEELAYLFLTISIGLGFGAGQWLVTITAFALIVAVLWIRQLGAEDESTSNLYLTVQGAADGKATLGGITEVLRPECAELDMKRFDQRDSELEVSYRVTFTSFEQLERAKRALEEYDSSMTLSFVDSEALV